MILFLWSTVKELFLDETIEESLDLEKASPKDKFDRFHPRKKHVVYPLIEKTCNIEKICKNYVSKCM